MPCRGALAEKRTCSDIQCGAARRYDFKCHVNTSVDHRGYHETKASLAGAVALVLGAGYSVASVWAGASDYVFEAVQRNVKTGTGRDVAVRLVRKPGGHPVAGAVILKTRLDMGPDNMAAMTSTVTPTASSEPLIYRFKADFTMAGRWALTLAAKVQGEPETVKGTVEFQATE